LKEKKMRRGSEVEEMKKERKKRGRMKERKYIKKEE
jgi:hypothetical protein